MNDIPVRQNLEINIHRLAAARDIYGLAKKFFVLQLALSGPLCAILALVAIAAPSLRGWIALVGLTIVVADVLLISPIQRHLKECAAKVQELFDCDVLSLDWHDLRAGSRPDPEMIVKHSRRYESWSGTMPPLTDWYSPEVGKVPLRHARIVCQRTNCWWDSDQRRSYSRAVAGTGLLLLLLVLGVGIGAGLSVEQLVASVLAPMSSTIVFVFRHSIEQSEAARRSERLKDHAQKLWDQSFGDTINMDTASRALQDEIFDGRRRNPLVLDSVFRYFRHQMNTQMNVGAEVLVQDARKRLDL